MDTQGTGALSVAMKKRAVLAAASVATVVALATTACGSGGGGDAAGPSAESVQSVSVPATVEKDSIQDLNSTKDMTGVVSTLPETSNPYVGHLPPVCPLFPDSLLQELGFEKSMQGLNQDYFKTCTFTPGGISSEYADAGLYTENIDELTVSNKNFSIVKKGVSLPGGKEGIALRATNTGVVRNCLIAWGTFFGSATVGFNPSKDDQRDQCETAETYAARLVSHFPRRPSEMRGGA